MTVKIPVTVVDTVEYGGGLPMVATVTITGATRYRVLVDDMAGALDCMLTGDPLEVYPCELVPDYLTDAVAVADIVGPWMAEGTDQA